MRLSAVTEVTCLGIAICHAQQRLRSAAEMTPALPEGQHTCVQPYVMLEHVSGMSWYKVVACAVHHAIRKQRHVAVAAGHIYTVKSFHITRIHHTPPTSRSRRAEQQPGKHNTSLPIAAITNCFALSVQFRRQGQFGTLKHEAEGAMFSAAQAHEQDVRKTG